MKKFPIFAFFLSFIFIANSNAQFFEVSANQKKSKFINSVYTEVGGAGIILSVNYDLIINERSVVRLGATPTMMLDRNSRNSRNSNDYNPYKRIVGIFSYSRIFGSQSNKFETGLGFIFGDQVDYLNEMGPPALFFNFGYRFLSSESNGIAFKASFTPFVMNEKIIPWAGVSFGYSFFNNN